MASCSTSNKTIEDKSDDESSTSSSETESDTETHKSTTPNKSAKSRNTDLVEKDTCNTKVFHKFQSESIYDNQDDNNSENKKSKKGRKTKMKKKRRCIKPDSSSDRKHSVETISENKSLIALDAKKLRKRPQVKKLFIDPNGAIERKLEHKYVELEDLLNRQFVERKTNLTHLHIGQMEILRQQYNLSCHGLPPAGGDSSYNRKTRPHSAHVRGASDSDETYSAIRTLQQTSKFRKPRSQIRSRSAKSIHETCSDSEAHRQKAIDINFETASLTSARNSPRGRKCKLRDTSDFGSRSSLRSKSSGSPSVSPSRGYIATDHKLKDTDNQLIKQWLHKKNVEYRKQRTVERAEKREKRKGSILRENEKLMARQAGRSKVEEWMKKKRREAFEQTKAEKARELALEEEKKAKEEKKRMEFVQGKSWMRPASAPAIRSKNKLESSNDDPSTSNDSENLPSGPVPHPPSSKLMYKRSAAGRVRLRVKSKERSESSEPAPDKSLESSQLSYSAWLENKRAQDQEKKMKAEEEAQTIAKSATNMANVLPHLHEKRMNRVLKSKKRVDSGMKSEDDDSQASPNPDSSVELFLSVNGSKAALSSRNGYSRPQSALAKPPVPQQCKSPKRPHSAHPRVDAIMDEEETDPDVEENPFHLPFPAALGLPKEVAKAQKKIFPERIAEEKQYIDGMRHSPQGCDSFPTADQPIMETSNTDKGLKENIKGDGDIFPNQEDEHPTAGESFFTKNNKEQEIPIDVDLSIPPEQKEENDDEERTQSFLEICPEKLEPDKNTDDLETKEKMKIPSKIFQDLEEIPSHAEVSCGQVNITELPSENIPIIGEKTQVSYQQGKSIIPETLQELTNSSDCQEDTPVAEMSTQGDQADTESDRTQQKYENRDKESFQQAENISPPDLNQQDTEHLITNTAVEEPSDNTEVVEDEIGEEIVEGEGEKASEDTLSFLDLGQIKHEPDKSLLEQVVESLPEPEDYTRESSSLTDDTTQSENNEQALREKLQNGLEESKLCEEELSNEIPPEHQEWSQVPKSDFQFDEPPQTDNQPDVQVGQNLPSVDQYMPPEDNEDGEPRQQLVALIEAGSHLGYVSQAQAESSRLSIDPADDTGADTEPFETEQEISTRQEASTRLQDDLQNTPELADDTSLNLYQQVSEKTVNEQFVEMSNQFHELPSDTRVDVSQAGQTANKSYPKTHVTEQFIQEPIFTEQSIQEPLVTNPLGTEQESLFTEPLGTGQETLGTEQSIQEPHVTEPIGTGQEPSVIEQCIQEPLVIEPLGTGQEPLVTEPLGTGQEPSAIEQYIQEPIVTEPHVTEPIGTGQEPLGTEQSIQEPLGTEQSIQEPLGTEQSIHEPLGTELFDAGQEPLGTEQSIQEPLGTEQSIQEPLGTEQSIQEPLGTEQSIQEPLVTELSIQYRPITEHLGTLQELGTDQSVQELLVIEEANQEQDSEKSEVIPILLTERSLTNTINETDNFPVYDPTASEDLSTGSILKNEAVINKYVKFVSTNEPLSSRDVQEDQENEQHPSQDVQEDQNDDTQEHQIDEHPPSLQEHQYAEQPPSQDVQEHQNEDSLPSQDIQEHQKDEQPLTQDIQGLQSDDQPPMHQLQEYQDREMVNDAQLVEYQKLVDMYINPNDTDEREGEEIKDDVPVNETVGQITVIEKDTGAQQKKTNTGENLPWMEGSTLISEQLLADNSSFISSEQQVTEPVIPSEADVGVTVNKESSISDIITENQVNLNTSQHYSPIVEIKKPGLYDTTQFEDDLTMSATIVDDPDVSSINSLTIMNEITQSPEGFTVYDPAALEFGLHGNVTQHQENEHISSENHEQLEVQTEVKLVEESQQGRDGSPETVSIDTSSKSDIVEHQDESDNEIFTQLTVRLGNLRSSQDVMSGIKNIQHSNAEAIDDVQLPDTPSEYVIENNNILVIQETEDIQATEHELQQHTEEVFHQTSGWEEISQIEPQGISGLRTGNAIPERDDAAPGTSQNDDSALEHSPRLNVKKEQSDADNSTSDSSQTNSDDLNNNKMDISIDNQQYQLTEEEQVLESLTDITSSIHPDQAPTKVTVAQNDSETLMNLKNEFNLVPDNMYNGMEEDIINQNQKTISPNNNNNTEDTSATPRKRVSFTNHPIIIQESSSDPDTDSDGADDVLRTMI